MIDYYKAIDTETGQAVPYLREVSNRISPEMSAQDCFVALSFLREELEELWTNGTLDKELDEITGSRGVVFATGTPISNSMAELFTMQRYLQRETLEQHGLSSFDAWASTFGETVTAVELAPEGYTLIGR